MPFEQGEKQAITIWIDKGLVERIDKLAEKAEVTRSKLISNIVGVGVEELEIMDTLGVLATARVFEELKNIFMRGRNKKTAKALS